MDSVGCMLHAALLIIHHTHAGMLSKDVFNITGNDFYHRTCRRSLSGTSATKEAINNIIFPIAKPNNFTFTIQKSTRFVKKRLRWYENANEVIIYKKMKLLNKYNIYRSSGCAWTVRSRGHFVESLNVFKWNYKWHWSTILSNKKTLKILYYSF